MLLIAASIRILKDVLINLYRIDPAFNLTTELWLFVENIGYSQQFAMGPLLFLYFRFRLYDQIKLKTSDLFHFIPYFVLMFSLRFTPWEFWINGGLIVSYLHFLIYFLLAAQLLLVFYQENTNDLSIKRWLASLLIIIGLLLLSYIPTAFKMVGNIAGAVLYAIAIIVVTLLVYRDRKILSARKYKTSSLSADKLDTIATKLLALIEERELYLDPSLSLQKLALILDLSSAHLSQVINEKFGKSYTDFITEFRIKTAKDELIKSENQQYKIAHIAFECGFDSLSSFNASFKKMTGLTPSEFRKKNEQLSGSNN